MDRGTAAKTATATNDAWLSPAGAYNTANGAPYVVTLERRREVTRPSSTIQIVDATYYGVCPDVTNQTGDYFTKRNGRHPRQLSGTSDKAFLAAQDGANGRPVRILLAKHRQLEPETGLRGSQRKGLAPPFAGTGPPS